MKTQQATAGYRFRQSDREVGNNFIYIYISVLTVIAAFVVYLDLGIYFFSLSGGAFLPKYLYIFLSVSVVPLIALRHRSFLLFLNTPFVLWVLAMISLNFLHWVVFILDGNTDLPGLIMTRVQILVLIIFLGFLVFQVDRSFLARIFVCLALVLTVLQVIDFFMPGFILPTDTPGVVPGRAGSTLVNANKAVESLVLLAVLGMPIIRPKWRIWFLLVIFPGVFLTFSRSGLICWFIVLMGGFWFKIFSRNTYLIVLLVLPVLLSGAKWLFSYVLGYVDSSATDNIFARVMFFVNFDATDHSAQERFGVAGYAFDSFISQPWFGNGAGYTQFWVLSDQAPHNQHLMILAEYGIVGYALFLWLFRIIFLGDEYFEKLRSTGMRMLPVVVFLCFSPFTHNMFDHLYWLLSFAILGQRMFFSKK